MEKENNNQNMVPNDKIEGNKNANVPNLRFKIDTGPWTKTALKEVCVFYKGVGISKEQLSKSGIECILYGQLYTTYKKEIIRDVLSKTNLSSKDLFCSKYNDVIIPASGETPEDIATACCVLKDNVLLGGDLNVLRPSSLINGCFLSYQLNGKRKYDIAKISQGASIVHLHNNDLKKLCIFIPSEIQIQNKIVDLLEKIDTIIETQNKIIKEYETYKKTISNIILYSNKNTYKKLSDFASLKNGYAFKSETYDDNGIYSIITIGNVTGNRTLNMDKTNKICRVPSDIQSHQILKINDIVVSLTGNVGRTSLVSSPGCLLNQRVGLIDVKEDSNRELIFQCLSTNLFEMKMISTGQGAAQLNIGKQDVEKFPIPINITVKQINLLKNIDLIIQKEKDILNAYKKQKAYLLQNMFI